MSWHQTVKCTFCREDISADNAYRRVIGWERKAHSASRRGGSDVVLREPCGDQWACQFCIDAKKAGRSPQQGALL